MSFVLQRGSSDLALHYLVRIINEARIFINPHINHNTPTFRTGSTWPSLIGFLEICLYSLGVKEKNFILDGNGYLAILNNPNRAGQEMYEDLMKANFIRFDTPYVKSCVIPKEIAEVANELST